MSEKPLTSTQLQDVDTSFRLFDFNIFDEKREENKDENSDGDGNDDGNSDDNADTRGEKKYKKDEKFTTIQMFGLNEKGETCTIFVRDYSPFFYIKVGDDWTIPQKSAFISHLKDKLGKYYHDSILDFESKLIKRKKLYGFDAGKEHKFVLIKFKNIATMNKVKNMWFQMKKGKQMLRRDGYYYSNTKTEIYEANIPPILRFFHINDISPSGWIGFQSKRVKQVRGFSKTTTCTYEYEIESKYIVPLNSKETIVPYKICSFDIEASSSHGDFPIPVKTYKKLATNMVDICGAVLKNMDGAGANGSDANAEAARYETIEKLLKKIVNTAFNHEKDPHADVDQIYTKIKVGESRLATLFGVWI